MKRFCTSCRYPSIEPNTAGAEAFISRVQQGVFTTKDAKNTKERPNPTVKSAKCSS